MKLEPVQAVPLRRQVYEKILSAIFGGRFLPGQPLKEMHLARELKVSQATVREALVELESAGFVSRVQNKGTVVTRLTKKEIRERISLRVMLEGLAGTQAAGNLTAADMTELRRLAQVIERVTSEEGSGLARADLDFHRYVWALSGNDTLVRTLEQLTAPLFAFVAIVWRTAGGGARMTINPHSEIIDALAAGNPALIQEAFRRHIEMSSPYKLFLESDFEHMHELVIAAQR